MNKVYYFEDGHRDSGVFIAAKNFKEAKQMSLTSNYDILAFISYVEIKGHLIRDENKKPYFTEKCGELELYELDEIGVPYYLVND